MTEQQQIAKLDETYLFDLFAPSVLENLTAATGNPDGITEQDLQQQTDAYINQYFQTEIENPLCELTPQNQDPYCMTDFRNGYSEFVRIINFSGSEFSDIPNNKTLKHIRQYVSDVPQLRQICDLIAVRTNYDLLAHSASALDFDLSKVQEFNNTVDGLDFINPDNRNNFKNGICRLYIEYGKTHQTPVNNSQAAIEPLDEDYLNNYFINEVYQQAEQDQENIDSLSQEDIFARAEKLREQELTEIRDGICSFDEDTYNKAWSRFLNITNLKDVLSTTPDEEITDTIEYHLQNMPELKELYELAYLYLEHQALEKQVGNNLLTLASVESLHKRIMKHRTSMADTLSDTNLANFEHGLVKLYAQLSDAPEDVIEQLHKDVLLSSDNPENIRESFNYFQYSSLINSITQETCNRVLQNRQDNLSDYDLYILYTTLGDTYQRSINKSGFRTAQKIEHMKESNEIAGAYYEAAYTHAPTKALQLEAARSLYRLNPEKYNNTRCAKEFPSNVASSSHSAPRPYSPADIIGKSRS